MLRAPKRNPKITLLESFELNGLWRLITAVGTRARYLISTYNLSVRLLRSARLIY